MMKPMVHLLAAALLVASICFGVPAHAQDADGDGIADRVELILGTDANRPDELQLVAESPERDDGSPDLRRLYMAHVAGDRFIWKVEFAQDFPVTGDTMVMYVDADNNPETGRQDKPEVRGTDVQYSCGGANIGASIGNPNVFEGGRSAARGVREGNAVWVADEVKLNRVGHEAVVRIRLLVQRAGDGSDSTDWAQVRVPVFADRELPELPGVDRLVNKGLLREQVEPPPGARANLPERRPQPPVPFTGNGRAPERGATVARERVPVNLLEEAGVDRTRELVTFGVPFPRGTIFDARMIRVLDEGGAELSAQVTATSFWPDDSIRWALVDLLADVDAGQERTLAVEYGSAVSRAPVPDALRIEEQPNALVISTGPLQATVPTDHMALLGEVRVNGRPVAATPEGIVVVGETGKVFRLANAAPEVRIEKRGPLATTIRLEAPYVAEDGAEYLRAIVRLTFVAGSTTVRVAATHIDDWLETEFTDIRSLTMPVSLASSGATVSFAAPEGRAATGPMAVGPGARIMQKHDQLAAIGGEEVEGLRLPGAMAYRTADGSGVTVAVLDFWREYPRALSATAERGLVEILPALDGEDFWTELPDHLRYPFVEGCYRMKWGMAKTTRMALHFYGPDDEVDPTVAARALDRPLVPVIDSAWYAQTGALGDMAAQTPGEFEAWDADVARRFAEHLELKEREREYGFLNWGDWFGERGRNWGNNEYDLPHGLFMQFARTGNRDYYRLALAAARHQADVDCVHAYPDIMNVGAMAPHSVCHTGEWSQHLAAPSWSYQYTSMTTAANGHTWADGMVDAWYLCGEPRVMECAQGLGEHIAFAMAPTFEHLGTHERSAGWSLAAIMALYRATGDPVYLEAARQIVEVALREQDLEGTGAWPHVLPTDHAAGYPGAVGNVAFLIGILMAGMQDYHQATGDPRVLTSMAAGCRWLREVMWVPDRRAFHYTSSPAYLNNPEKARTGVNMLIIPPMAYVAEQTGDAALMDIVAQAFVGVLRDGGSGWGKSYAQQLHFASDILGALSRADESGAVLLARHLDLAELRRQAMLQAPPATHLRVRGPTDKVVHLLREDDGLFTIEATRLPYGARPHEEDSGTLEVVAPDGEVVAQAQFDTDDEWTWSHQLPAGGPPGTYTVRIHDDMRATWDVTATGNRRVIELVPGLSLGGIGTGRWALYAPPGVTRFTLTVVDWHRGHFGAMVLGPDGEVLAAEDATQPAEGAGKQAVLEVTLPANPGGAMLDVVLYTDMDLNVAVEGIPPYLAPSPEAWFDPREH